MYLSHLILFSHLHLLIPSDLFPSVSDTKTEYVFLFSPMRATRPTHPSLPVFYMPVLIGKQYKSWSSSLFSFLQPRATSFVFGPNILVNTNRGSPKVGSRAADKISGRLTVSSRVSWAGYEKFHLYSTKNITRERQELMQHNRALSPVPDRRVPANCKGCPPPSSVLTIAAFVAVLPSEQRVKSPTDSPYSSQILEQRWFKAGRRIPQPDLKASKFPRQWVCGL
jgi:hypothetical protein